ncbi:MAG: hypothetical protein J5819_08190 [Eubacterium sp.]|nr:hypothetical protein [Eubacterium sp.]
MVKFKNGKKSGKWSFKTGSRKRRFKVRSLRPGKWTLLFRLGSNAKKKNKRKMDKLRKLKKMNKMAKQRKMFLPTLPKLHIKRKAQKINKARKIARLPMFKIKKK